MTRFVVLLLLAFPALADWRIVRDGVEMQHVAKKTFEADVVRVDLHNAKLRVIATDEAQRGLSVRDFAKRTHAIVAINGDYFTDRMETIGTAMGACGVWSKAKKTRSEPWIAVGKKRASIDAYTKPRGWMSGVVAGWPLLVDGCAAKTKLPGSDAFTRAKHRRTAVGLSDDGRWMYFVIVTGRGATLPELASFLHELGACTALNLDGGSSTSMWVDGALVPGSANGRVANHLAVIASDDYSADCGAPALRNEK